MALVPLAASGPRTRLTARAQADERMSVGFAGGRCGRNGGSGMGGGFSGGRARAQDVRQAALIVTIRDRATGQAL